MTPVMARFKLEGLHCAAVVLLVSVLTGALVCASSIDVGSQTHGAVSGAAKGSSGEGKLTGRVTRGPTVPVVTAGMPSPSEPAPNIKLVITRKGGQTIGSVVTDENGLYNMNLPPGTYHIDTKSLTGMEFTRDLPASVVITEGCEIHLDIHVDTGMR
jgi:hypothetical protein